MFRSTLVIHSLLLFLALALGMQVADAKIPNFHQVSPGIYRGAQPTEKSDYQRLKKLGIKSIINLRTYRPSVWIEKHRAEKHGINFIYTPLSATSKPTRAEIIEVLNKLNDPSVQPVFLHCRFGKDRTGLIVALQRVLYEGWTAEQAYAEWLEKGFNTDLKYYSDYYREHLENN